MPGITLSGAASGLDTASIIDQLIQVESNSQQLLQARQASIKKRADAYAQLITTTSSLASQASALANTATWSGSTATSSSSAVTATATGTTSGSVTFRVDATASAHALISSTGVASTGTVVAASGTLTVKGFDGSVTGTLDVGGGTLSEVVAAVNTSDLGLRASAVQTSPGSYRLQISAANTGVKSQFTVEGLTEPAWSTLGVLAQGSDAQVTVGSLVGTQYSVTSATNTFTDLVPGLNFAVSKAAVGTDVTVSASVDGAGPAGRINSFVAAVNNALSSISSLTAYDLTSRTGAPLSSDSSVKSLRQQILSMANASAVPGISLTKDGLLAFDQTAFTDAFKADPRGTAALYGASLTLAPASGVTASVELVAKGTTTKAGDYALALSTAAVKESWQLSPVGTLTGQSLSFVRGDTTVSYTLASEDLSAEASALNGVLAQAGFGASVQVQSGSLVVTATSAGADAAFTANLNASAGIKLTSGTDIAGTIDGKTALGVGDTLTLNDTSSGADGLAVKVTTTAGPGTLGSLTYTPGLAQRMATFFSAIGDVNSGPLSTSKASALSQVDGLQTQIDAWDTRLATHRATLNRQFTAMETALASLRSSLSGLSSMISGLPSS